MRPKELMALSLLGALWGGSFLFIRVAVPALGPFVLMELRVGLAAVALALYAVAVSGLPKLRTHWKEFLILGGLNGALPFTLIAASEINLTASLAAILNSTTPLFTAMVAAAWIKDGLTARRIVGLALGVGGGDLDAPGRRWLPGGATLPRRHPLRASTVVALDGDRSPALLPPYRQR